MNWKKNLKVGQEVRVIANKSGHEFHLRQEVTILSLLDSEEDEINESQVFAKSGEEYWYLSQGEFETLDSNGWISVEDRLPEPRDCDKFSSFGYSDKLIVFDGKEVIDDVRLVFHIEDGYSFNEEGSEMRHRFLTHCFGYSNDQHEIEGVTHFQYLRSIPEPPK